MQSESNLVFFLEIVKGATSKTAGAPLERVPWVPGNPSILAKAY